jgi:pimeloyl-ACP methyl ester carboxylesterase
MSESTITANGISIAYDEFGKQDDPVILLIMGLGTQMIAWTEEFCLGLVAKGYRVVRFDNRDVGLSQKFDDQKPPNLLKGLIAQKLGVKISTPYTLFDMADDAIGVMDALAIQRAHIVGASMGGMISQILAAEHPERVISLTSIMSTSGHKSLPSASWDVTKHMIVRKAVGSEADYLDQMVSFWQVIGSPKYMPEEQALRERMSASFNRCYYPMGYKRQLAAIAACGDRVELLKRITVPTCVIHGRSDVLVPVEGGIDTARHIKHSTLEVIDGMGHDLPQPLYGQFIGLITDNANKAA